jgi:hypothetical protein
MPKQFDIKGDGTPVLTGLVDGAFSLVSSTEPGEVSINPNTGVMSTNPYAAEDAWSLTDEISGGKRVWQRRFDGAITRPMGPQHDQILITEFYNLERLIGAEGYWTGGDGSQYQIGCIIHQNTNDNIVLIWSGMIASPSEGYIMLRTRDGHADRINSPYDVIVKVSTTDDLPPE